VKLRHLDEWTAARQRNAALYRERLGGETKHVRLPRPAEYQTRHIWNQFVVCCKPRDELRAHLQARGVGSEIYYPLSLHEQRCFRDLGYRQGDFPESERAASRVLALPIHPGLSTEDVDYVAAAITEFRP
jgi:dTDP-4-amino-4,6-dideoxygalactose transaminase